jgi:late competence protein required for DNA uptake (superfamily II DNA/RNA helicase)
MNDEWDDKIEPTSKLHIERVRTSLKKALRELAFISSENKRREEELQAIREPAERALIAANNLYHDIVR